MKVIKDNGYCKHIYGEGIYTIIPTIGDATYTVKPTKSGNYYKVTLKTESGVETTIRTRCKIETALEIADKKAFEYFTLKSELDRTAPAQESESAEESEKAAEKQDAASEAESTITVKKITARQAREINLRNGMETWEEDGQKTYWAAYADESGTFQFDSIRERDEFIERKNRKQDESGITEVTDESGNMELVDSDGEVLVRVERTSDSEVCIVEFAGRDGTKHRTLRPWFTDAVEYARWKADRIVLHKSYNLPVDFGLEYETEERWQADMEKYGIIEYHPENAPDIVVEYLSAGDCSSLSAVYDHHRGITVRRIRRLHAATYVFDSLEEAIDRARMSAIDEAHRRAGVRRTIFGK